MQACGDSCVEIGALEPFLVIRRRAAQANQRFVHRRESSTRPHRVIQFERLPRCTSFGIPLIIASAIKGKHADLVHLQMIGVRITALI
ncbi:MAG: hypothetical protein EBU98_04575, partial [Actinobacteria bacterium]|nr:hypothetical protein [Actinomycetota bacterium]